MGDHIATVSITADFGITGSEISVSSVVKANALWISTGTSPRKFHVAEGDWSLQWAGANNTRLLLSQDTSGTPGGTLEWQQLGSIQARMKSGTTGFSFNSSTGGAGKPIGTSPRWLFNSLDSDQNRIEIRPDGNAQVYIRDDSQMQFIGPGTDPIIDWATSGELQLNDALIRIEEGLIIDGGPLTSPLRTNTELRAITPSVGEQYFNTTVGKMFYSTGTAQGAFAASDDYTAGP